MDTDGQALLIRVYRRESVVPFLWLRLRILPRSCRLKFWRGSADESCVARERMMEKQGAGLASSSNKPK